MKHPAGPFTVRVYEYSLEPNRVGMDRLQVWSSRHRSPHAAGKVLASIITRRTIFARQVQACIPRGKGGAYVIEIGDGTQYPLNAFRSKFCT